VQNLGVLYQDKNWIDVLAHCKKRSYQRYLFSAAEPGCARARTGLMLWHTVTKDVIKDVCSVVQNLGVLNQGKNWI
jgi:hypothetical protein